MTQNPPPAGTDGNPPPITVNQVRPSGRNDLASNRETSDPGNDQNVIQRNSARQIRRDAGEKEVSDDESDDGSRANSPPAPTDATSQGNVTQFLAAFTSLPAADRRQIEAVFSAALKGTDTLPRGPLLTADLEKPAIANGGGHKFGIHPNLRDLAANRQHLPLTLFLAKSQRMMFLEQIPTITIRRAGSKVTIIKTDHFPSENVMEPGEWMEAWGNYLIFLEAEADEAVLNRWKAHYHYLSSYEDQKIHFPAILRFDIEQRKEYMAAPSTFDQLIYNQRFTETKAALILDKIQARERREELATNNAHTKARYDPYSRPPALHAPRDNPFPRGNGGTSVAPICLICARTGHRFSDCNFNQTEKGRPTWCRMDGVRLVSVANRQLVCISWNIGNTVRCKAHHDNLHTCSFCGSRDHHACSRTCI